MTPAMADVCGSDGIGRQLEGAELATYLEPATQLIDTPGNSHVEGPPDADVPKCLQEVVDDFRSDQCSEFQVAAALQSLAAQAAAQNVETQEYGHDPKYRMFKSCVDQGCKFDLRNDPIGREWNKAVASNAQLRKDYEKCRTHKQKHDMRADWLQRVCNQLRYGKNHEKRWEKTDVTKGDYMPFGMLVESFGIHYDRKAAVEAATLHAEKCIKMQGDWMSYDSMGEVVEYLKLRKGFTERMQEAWTLWEEEQACNTDGGGTRASGTRDSQASSSGMRRSASSEGVVASGKRAAGEETPKAGKAGKKQKNDALEKALAESIKVKKLHREATAQAENVASQIDSSPDWAWARTQESVGALRALILQLKEQKTPAVSQFILEDLKDLRREIGAETLLAMANEFNALRPALEAIDEKQSALRRGHKSMFGK